MRAAVERIERARGWSPSQADHLLGLIEGETPADLEAGATWADNEPDLPGGSKVAVWLRHAADVKRSGSPGDWDRLLAGFAADTGRDLATLGSAAASAAGGARTAAGLMGQNPRAALALVALAAFALWRIK